MTDTLINPPWYRRLTVKHGLYALAGIVLLGAILFTIDRCDGYWSNRGIEKKKAEANAKIEEAQQVKQEIANLEVKKAVLVTEAEGLVKEVKTAEENTNKALENANNVTPTVGITGEELEKKLKGIK